MLDRQAGFILVLAAVFALAAQGMVSAAAPMAGPHVTLKVDSVLAADTHEGMDARLGSIRYRLQALFDYSTYRLLKHQQASVACGKMVGFALPGGRILHVKAMSIDGAMIAMELVLFEGARPIMSTDLKLMNNGILMIGGPRYEQGMLIITIGAYTPQSSAPSEAPPPTPATPDVTTPVSNVP